MPASPVLRDRVILLPSSITRKHVMMVVVLEFHQNFRSLSANVLHSLRLQFPVTKFPHLGHLHVSPCLSTVICMSDFMRQTTSQNPRHVQVETSFEIRNISGCLHRYPHGLKPCWISVNRLQSSQNIVRFTRDRSLGFLPSRRALYFDMEFRSLNARTVMLRCV